MRKTTRVLVALVFLLAAILLGLRHVALSQASWPCDEVVVDRAGALGDGLADVRNAAERLIALGADVRVFVVSTTGLGDVEPFADRIQKDCPSWSAADGEMKNNLIVLGVSVEERRTGFFYGADWIALLNPEQLRIQSEVINPYFQNGDFAAGLAAGLDEVARLIDLQRHPRLPTAVPPTAAPQVTAVVQPGGGTQPSGPAGLIVAGVVAGLAVAAAAVGGGVALARSRAARRRAQQHAREAKLKVADRVLRLPEEIAYAEAEVENVSRVVAPEEAADLPKMLAEARRLIKQANADYDSVQLAGGDPDRERLTVAEYEGFAASFEELLGRLDQAGKLVTEAREQARSLQGMISQVPAALAEAGTAIADAQAQVATRSGEFPNRHAGRLVEQAGAKLEEGRTAGADRRPRQGLALIGEVRPLLEQAVAAAGQLPALRERIAQVEGTIDQGATIFEQLAAQYADSSWQAVRGNGTEAENRVAWAREALSSAAEGLAAADEGRWPEAQQKLTQANTWLDEAAGLIESIRTQQQSLEKARQDAPQEAQATREDLARAREYIRQYDPDIREELERGLDQAEADLGSVEKELAEARPDYPSLLNQFKAAHDAADRVLAQARDEHETIERLRQKYDGAWRDAQRAVSSASNYARDHLGDVRRDAREALGRAESTLRAAGERRAQADQNEDVARREALEAALLLLQQAGEQADGAYASARQDVRRAEESRRPVVIPLPSVGGTSWSGGWGTPRSSPGWGSERHDSSGGTSHGGSSTGWGGSAHRGGSSTSWGRSGGSSRRGGSSTGW